MSPVGMWGVPPMVRSWPALADDDAGFGRAREGRAMALRLRWVDGEAERLIDVEAADGATVASLAAALARQMAVPFAVAGGGEVDGPGEQPPLTIARREGQNGPVVVLPPGVPLDAGQVRSGDSITVVRAEPSVLRPAAAALITVVEGPDAGATFHVGRGVHLIGSHPDAAIRLGDPTVAPRHAQLVIGESVSVRDLGSAHGVVVAERYVTRAALAWREELVLGRSRLRIDAPGGGGGGGVVGALPLETGERPVLHTRVPRIVPRPDGPTLRLPVPPRPQAPRPWPLMALLSPAAMGLAMFAFTGRVLTLAFVALSPLLAIGSALDSRRSAHRQLRSALAVCEQECAAAERRLGELKRQLLAAALEAHPPQATIQASTAPGSPLLWWRRPEHPEFLSVCLGEGDVRSGIVIEGGETPAGAGGAGDAPPPRALAGALAAAAARVAALAADAERIPCAPVAVHLRDCGSLGIAGAGADAVARAAMLQFAVLHAPADLRIAAIDPSSPGGRSTLAWLRWLPHARVDTPGADTVAHGERAAEELLDLLERVIASRRAVPISEGRPEQRGPVAGHVGGMVACGPAGAQGGEQRGAPDGPQDALPAWVVWIADGGRPQLRARAIRIAELGPDVGVHVVWTAADRTAIPAACRTVAEVAGADTGPLDAVRTGDSLGAVRWRRLALADADALASSLAGARDAAELAAEESLPPSVQLLALHGARAVDPQAVAERWRAGRGEQGVGPSAGGLRALLGRLAGEPWYVDLAREGPHALVAGTTGAGKSELLQAWVLALASAYSPAEVNLLLVDYKGGSAFGDCVRLPHTVGLVTDLTPALVQRALVSLRAELRHRERLLAAAGFKDRDAMAAARPAEAPPRLVIVVDEFAALASEVPQFIDGVVDVAQRGRSLGLHLILATQRPAGVIKENVRANTALRIALRVHDEADSRDVLGTVAAAQVPVSAPGRGWMRAAGSAPLAFQAAHVGARTSLARADAAVTIWEYLEVSRCWQGPGADGSGDLGAWDPGLGPTSPAAPDGAAPTDGQRIVAAIKEAFDLSGASAPRRPWLESLPESLPWGGLAAVGSAVWRTPDSIPGAQPASPEPTEPVVWRIGIADDPANQRQLPLEYRPDLEGALLVVGGPGSGRSTCLRSLAAAAVAASTGGMHVYGIDAASGLQELAGAQVGGVVHADDEEQVARLLAMLAGRVRARARGAGDAAGDRATSAAWESATSAASERATGARAASAPRALLLIDGWNALMSGWICEPWAAETLANLRLVMEQGRVAGVAVAVSADRPGGAPASLQALLTRVLLLRPGDEAHAAMLGLRGIAPGQDAPAGRLADAQSRLMCQLALPPDLPQEGVQAPPIARLPEVLLPGDVPQVIDGLPTLGLESLGLEPMPFDPDRSCLVTGSQASDRTAALAWMLRALAAARPGRPLLLLSPRASALAGLGLWQRMWIGPDALELALPELRVALGSDATEGTPTLVIERVADFAGCQGEGELVSLLRRARRLGHVVFAEEESQSWSAGSLAMELRGIRRGLLMGADPADAQLLFQAQVPRGPRTRVRQGSGLWAEAGKGVVVHIPLVELPSSTDAAVTVPGGLARA